MWLSQADSFQVCGGAMNQLEGVELLFLLLIVCTLPNWDLPNATFQFLSSTTLYTYLVQASRELCTCTGIGVALHVHNESSVCLSSTASPKPKEETVPLPAAQAGMCRIIVHICVVIIKRTLSIDAIHAHTHTHTHVRTADNGFKGQAVDIWAAGITLYVFVFGRVSWKFVCVCVLSNSLDISERLWAHRVHV